MAHIGTQSNLPLAFGVHRGPKDAPPEVLRVIKDRAQALRVSMKAAKLKNAYVGLVIGHDASYVSRMKNGQRPVPDDLVDRLCRVTGSNLLRQFVDRFPKPRDCQLAEVLRSQAA